eukprot:Seg757.1 transcript_id=Seg757.1/GoldUCD/mRNA.D3Y31 product="Metabotropic glutamate receptor 4" protein_id=Seg757.1/GoldUCD/D3Y31
MHNVIKIDCISKVVKPHFLDMAKMITNFILLIIFLASPGQAAKSQKLRRSSTPYLASLAARLPTTKGNSTLTGYFAVHSPIIRGGTARCGPINVQDGVLLLEAFRYAINVTNHMGILPKGFTLGYQLFDTCKSTVELKKHISPTLFSEDEKLTGVVGPYTSSEAVLAASVFSVFKTTEISYKASSLELEDRGRYNNFFRTVPSDRFEAKAILDIMKHFKWLYLSCISSHERQQGVFVLKSLIENDRRCIAKQVSLPEIPKTATYQDAIDSVSVDKKAKVIILFTTREDTIGLLSAAKKKGYGKGVVWIGGTGWGNLLMQSDWKGIGDGAISLNYPFHQHDSGFREYFCSLNPKRNKYGYFKEFWQSVFDCTYDSSKDYDKKLCTNREKLREGKEFPKFTTIGPVMDAVYVYAQTLTKSLKKTCGEQITISCVKSNYYSSILHWIKLSLSTDVFKSLNKNDNISFDAVGGVKGKFDILNLIWKNGVYVYEKIGSWQAGTGKEGLLDIPKRIHWPEGVKGPVLSRCSEPCKPQIGEVKMPTLSIKGKHCCWDCHQCKPNDIVSVNETCVTCGNDYEPDETRSKCNKLTEISVSFNHPVGIVAIALSALGILLTTFVIGLFIYHNTAPIVKASGRELSYFMLVAIYICFAAAIVFLCPPTKTICGIQRFIAGLSLNLCYASLLLKTNRLYRIFKHATLSVARPSLTSPFSQVIIALAITSIQVLLGVVWSIGFSGLSGHSEVQQLVQNILLDFQKKLNPSKQPSAKFQKAIFVMQREAANDLAFQYVRQSNRNSTRKRRSLPTKTANWLLNLFDRRLLNLKKFMKIAVTSNSIKFARSAFAKSLIVFIEKENRKGTPVNKLSAAADGFLQQIKSDIGEKNFSKLMLDNGEATLMFAIDTTGSMGSEINAAKAIATKIINMQRQFEVDYILSPFNDPGTGPTTYKSAAEKEEFVTAIQRLSATGGGDCPELALQGMRDAFYKNPKLGSPMFVFTDAGAKDDTYSMREQVKSYASQYQATINFFTHASLCHTGIAPFREIASYTSGQIFPLQSDADITKFTDFVGNSLKDSTIIDEGSNKQDYHFVVDGEVNILLLSLNAIKSSAVRLAALIDPFGAAKNASQTTAYSRIYTIANPATGQWHLRFPNSSGSKNATVMLQISGSELLDHRSLLLDVISESGNILEQDVILEQTAGGTGIMKGLITTPNEKFKIEFKGKTKDGQNFTRISQSSMNAALLALLPINAGEEFTASVNNTKTPILIYVYNNGVTEYIHFSVSSTKGYTTVDKTNVMLAKATNATVGFTHQPPINAVIGNTVSVVISATGQTSGTKAQLKVTMMYVP